MQNQPDQHPRDPAREENALANACRAVFSGPLGQQVLEDLTYTCLFRKEPHALEEFLGIPHPCRACALEGARRVVERIRAAADTKQRPWKQHE